MMGAKTFKEFLELPDNELTLPQSWWLDASIDLVIKFEDLPSSFEQVFSTPLAVINASMVLDQYTPETRDLVATRYAEDFSRFNYVL